MYYYSTTFSGGPGQKCPPDRGSLDCVTGSPASSFTDSLSSSPESNYPHTYLNNSYRASSPKNIPSRYTNSPTCTPPLTPDDASDYSKSSGSSFDSSSDKDALDFLMTIFPRDGLSALPYSKRVSISSPNLSSEMNGVVMELPGKSRTLFVDGKSASTVNLRESIVALLDLADESLDCSGLVIVLERSSPNLGNVLHSLMYVGGSVVTKPPFQVDPAFILVGLDV
ncbi:hypothetical protein CVT24_000173 [Panaeolus cyanescens]|uniref:Ornithine decarboxylase antizyme n=1 Tax=Panaeolus cyanescens TaxID=181874 RepID=A0A409VWQ9_9AGAR|nr:hypothetical protein CVT24_000173 [Panaeolus cyanescens]